MPTLYQHSHSALLLPHRLKHEMYQGYYGGQAANHTASLIMLSQSNVANPYQAAKKRYLAELEQQQRQQQDDVAMSFY